MVFERPEFDGHEQVLFCHDRAVGLQAIIAIHDTTLGPAAGGCRMLPYDDENAALADVLRLSQGMSYKNAMAGLPLGGGKCVIIADPQAPGKEELLRAFARHVQSLGGRFWTAIDVGVGPDDAEIMAQTCDYIFANTSRYEEGFNPSEYTALGGLIAMQAAATYLWGDEGLAGRRVAIQGLGAAGSRLASHVHAAGAELVVADVVEENVERAVRELGATAVAPSQIHLQDVDVFAPCALGAILNDETIPEIRASMVCGLANNQLAAKSHGEALVSAGIIYVPDYVANCGGISAAGSLIYSTPSKGEILLRLDGLHQTVVDILELAAQQGRPTSDVADEMARARIASGATVRSIG